MSITKEIYKKALKLGCCSSFKGTETTDELIQLFTTPQGIEFCGKYNFPDLLTLRTFRGLQASRHGVFIDVDISRENLPKVILIGSTVAKLTYTDPNKRHEVIVMYGAKAIIKASGYAVVCVMNYGGEVETHLSDNAKAL